jgi:hypothetical protein
MKNFRAFLSVFLRCARTTYLFVLRTIIHPAHCARFIILLPL